MCRNLISHEAGAVVIQSFLSQLGIDVEIRSYDTGLFNTYLRDPDEWDFAWVSCTASVGLVLDQWNYLFADIGGRGTISHIQDPKLQELLNDAIYIHDAASIDAFHYYVIEQAYGRNMFILGEFYIGQKDITGKEFNFIMNPTLNAFTFTDDYETVVKR